MLLMWCGVVTALVAAGVIVAVVNRRAMPPIPDDVERG